MYRAKPPIRKVKSEYLAKQIVEIADTMLIPAEYTYSGRWYVISFDCTDYEFMFLDRKLKKELTHA